MKKIILLFTILGCVLNGFAQPPNRPVMVAGFPVNYDENLVGSFALPDLFALADGKRVTNAETWMKKRRPELLELFEEIQFGKAPPRPRALKFDVFDKWTPVFDGKAVRRQVTIYLTKERAEHRLNLVIYLPANVRKKAPLLLNISFSAPNQVVDDAGLPVGEIWSRENKKVKADRPAAFGKIDVGQFIDAGFGFATFYYGDIEPDFKEGFRHGIRVRYLRPGQTEPAKDEWGAIAAWAWGLSRVMDYFETDRRIDSTRIALQGSSRLGKTVLWAGVRDARFKLVIASISGEGGAALSRRNYGETIRHITDPSRYYYQFAPHYHTYSDRIGALPFDAHSLVALMAPRPLLLQTGSTDYWSDPKGEFLAAVAAEPVYRLFGKSGPATNAVPSPNSDAMLLNDLGFYMHDGGHTVLPEDWAQFVKYLKKYL